MAILLLRISDVLASEGVLDLYCGSRDAIDEENHVDFIRMLLTVTHLANDAEDVRLIASDKSGVDAGGWLKKAEAKLNTRHHFHAVSHQVKRAELRQMLPKPLEELC